ncbi:MAG: hypothetical protein KJO16_01230 [Muriicola sp.]|nr:hypothetical protein [Muriicola sp.]NNK09960.1 hypothetical protein [Flavobacteriaceae bacterium]
MNQQSLPGASNALTMGILSVVLTLLCCGPFGIIFTILGLNSTGKAERLYKENPGMYTGYENVKTGRVLSYVGLALSIGYLIFLILYIGVIITFISAGEFNDF